MTGDVNVINCGDSSVGSGRRVCVCVFVLRRQRILIAKLIDLFLLPFTPTGAKAVTLEHFCTWSPDFFLIVK